jgi:taurine transport system substrate-binding protein
MSRLLGTALSVCLFVALAAGTANARDITIGYGGPYNPWKVSIDNGDFEKATGQKIDWRKFDSGSKIVSAMLSGSVDMSIAGSSPIAVAITRGLEAKIFFILEPITSAEALVVRDGSGIIGPQDLKGKKLAIPFLSTTHFHAMFALEQFGIGPKEVELLNLQPPQIAAAWERGDIDAAYVWDPALGRIQKTGKVLIHSGQLCGWGKCTFDGLLVMNKFEEENPDFMVQFTRALDAVYESYRSNPDAWTVDSPQVAAIAKLSGGNAEDIPRILAAYDWLTLEEQASCNWLGCGTDGAAAQALYFTAKFLQDQKKVDKILPDYSVGVTDRWVKAAMKK